MAGELRYLAQEGQVQEEGVEVILGVLYVERWVTWHVTAATAPLEEARLLGDTVLLQDDMTVLLDIEVEVHQGEEVGAAHHPHGVEAGAVPKFV
jgi:hypothetical protein